MENVTLTDRDRALVANAVSAYRDILAAELGQQTYGGDRDYYRILGYKQEIQIRDYHTRYKRNDIAARIVDLPAQDTWRKPPQINENGAIDTPFVNAWDTLVKRLRVWSVLSRLDRLSGIGRYGVLLLGLRGGTLNEPVQPGNLGEGDLLYLRPFAELNAEIDSLDENPNSPRYGRPVTYNVQLTDKQTFQVHHTRVLHVADNKLDNEIYGIPRLQKVWNRLDDLMKLVGGSAEATWLNMRRGTVFTTREGFKLSGDQSAVDERQDMIRRYVHDMARVLTLEGLEVSDLGSSTVDPRGAFEVAVALISAATNIPQRVLIGSAQGELAAAEQDTKIWYDFVASRQVTWAEPEVLRPFIDRLVDYGILPAPSGAYDVGLEDDTGRTTWPSLWQISETERASISMNRGQAVAAVRNPVTGTAPVTEGEIRNILGLPYAMPGGKTPEPEEDEGEEEEEEEDVEEEEPEAPTGEDQATNLETAIRNYEAGEISATQLAHYAALQWVERDRYG